MPKILKRITSWSYSRLKTWEQCAQLAKFKYIDKLPEPGSPHLDRGNAVHKQLEDYVQGFGELPAELRSRHGKELKAMRACFAKGIAHVEEQWCFTKDWKSTGWFDADAWCRVKMDYCRDGGKVVDGVDYKTGKYRPGEYAGQLLQYCAAMLLMFPQAEEANCKLMFFDVDAPPTQLKLKRAYLQQTLNKLNEKVEPMLADTRFAPTPGPLCKWCAFSKTKGGPCKVA